MAEPRDIWELYSHKYKIYIKVERGLSANTVESYMRDLRQFSEFISKRYEVSPLEVDMHMVEDFMTELFERNTEKSTQGRMLSGIGSFYDFLLRTDIIDKSPTEFVDHPKTGQYLPDTLSVDEIDKILAGIDISTKLGYRNRAMIEMLYSCGLRVSELTSLNISDLFLSDGFIRITGKGNKQRLVPVNDECSDILENYLKEYREKPADEKSSDTLFLNRRGKKMSRVMVFNIIKDASAIAGLNKEVSPHTFRHSFATHLLQGGANIRQVQELLGHESITTTEIYTHLDTEHLYNTLREHHPMGQKK